MSTISILNCVIIIILSFVKLSQCTVGPLTEHHAANDCLLVPKASNVSLQLCKNKAILYNSTTESKQKITGVKSGWISHVLSNKLSNFQPKSKTNQLCDQQVQSYLRNLENLTLWAVKMQEASATSTEGMLEGKIFNLGHYDECIGIQTAMLAGRYCLASIKFAPTTHLYPDFYDHPLEGRLVPPESYAWDAIKKSEDPVRFKRDSVQWGLCVPSACSWQDVEESLVETFAAVEKDYNIIINVSLPEYMCSSSVDEKSPTFATKVIIYAIVILSILCILVTVYHLIVMNTKANFEGEVKDKLIICFSMVENFKNLTQESKENLNVLNGIKFHIMLFMVVVHRVAETLAGMIFNPNFVEERIEGGNILLIQSAIVDTYFAIAGILTFTAGYNLFKSHGMKMIPVLMLHRWLRFMPAYLAVIAFTIHVLPYIEEGPVWKSVVYKESEHCRQHWWTNFFGVNNMIAVDESCLLHGWYMANDLQFLPLGGLLVYLFSRKQSLGLTSAVIALIVSMVIPFSVTYINRYEGVIRLYMSVILDPRGSDNFRDFYVKPWNRAGPYIVGIISGYLLLKIKNDKWKLSMSKRWIIILVAIVVGEGAQLYGLVFYDTKREYDPIEHALYASTHRTLWAIMICTIAVIQLAWGLGGSVDLILTHKIYTPLSRLVYAVFLINPIWQLVFVASLRTTQYLSKIHIATLAAGDFLLSYLLGLWLYMIVDRPAGNIRKMIMEKIVKTEKTKKT